MDTLASGNFFRAGTGDFLPGLRVQRSGYGGSSVFRQHKPVVSSEEALASGLSWDYDWTMLDTGCKSEAFIFCLPLMAAFPAALSVLTDLRSGFIKSYLGRCGLRPYIVSKVILSTVSGAAAFFLDTWGRPDSCL